MKWCPCFSSGGEALCSCAVHKEVGGGGVKRQEDVMVVPDIPQQVKFQRLCVPFFFIFDLTSLGSSLNSNRGAAFKRDMKWNNLKTVKELLIDMYLYNIFLYKIYLSICMNIKLSCVGCIWLCCGLRSQHNQMSVCIWECVDVSMWECFYVLNS